MSVDAAFDGYDIRSSDISKASLGAFATSKIRKGDNIVSYRVNYSTKMKKHKTEKFDTTEILGPRHMLSELTAPS